MGGIRLLCVGVKSNHGYITIFFFFMMSATDLLSCSVLCFVGVMHVTSVDPKRGDPFSRQTKALLLALRIQLSPLFYYIAQAPVAFRIAPWCFFLL